MFKKGGFTLVELIVVITILAILGTIGFISLQGYSKSARDSTRISDIGNIKKGLILYGTNKEPYPDPSGYITVTFSGSEVWKQGTFGESVFKEVGILSNVPLDPLTKTEYAYSLLNTGKEFELGGILEGELSKIGTKANAEGTTIAQSYISGNFDSKIAKVEQGETTYVIAVPTLIASDLTNPDYETIVNTNSLAFKGTSKLAASFGGTNFNTDGNGNDIVINPGKEVLFSGDINNIDGKEFVDNLKSAYSGTTISNNNSIKEILSLENDSEINNYANNIISNSLEGNINESSCSILDPVYETIVFNTSASYNYALYSAELENMEDTQRLRYVGCGVDFTDDNCGLTIGEIYDIRFIVKGGGAGNYMALENDDESSYRTDLINMPSNMKFEIYDESITGESTCSNTITENNSGGGYEVGSGSGNPSCDITYSYSGTYLDVNVTTSYDYALYDASLETVNDEQLLRYIGCGAGYGETCGLEQGRVYQIYSITKGRGTGNYMSLRNDAYTSYRGGIIDRPNDLRFEFASLENNPCSVENGFLTVRTRPSFNYAMYSIELEALNAGQQLKYLGCGAGYAEDNCGLTIGEIYEIKDVVKGRDHDNYMTLWDDSNSSYRTDLINMPTDLKFQIVNP